MEGLNYHHLLYFWAVAREGGITSASRRLGVGRPAISMQLKSLEASLGAPLFRRRGRHLQLTETGEVVLRHADDIFRTGRELLDAVRGFPAGRPRRFRVGIADVMAKLVAFRLLLPALEASPDSVLECREEAPTRLFAALAVHELDLVLSDVPLAPSLDVRAYNHVVGESTTTLFAAPALARRLRRGFPGSLTGAPFLLPSATSAIRHSLDQWLAESGLRPSVVGEFEDGALMKVFGEAGIGVFHGPTIVADEICTKYCAEVIGEIETVRERYYAVSPERRIRHPAVSSIVENAKRGMSKKP